MNMNNYGQMAGTPFTQRNSLSPYFNPTTGASAPINNIVWVQGIDGAKSWPLSPNSTVLLLDNEVEGKMYIKISDNIGMSTLRVFNYTEETETPSSANVTINQDVDFSNLVKKDELNELIKEYLEKNEQFISTTTPKYNVVSSAGDDNVKKQ